MGSRPEYVAVCPDCGAWVGNATAEVWLIRSILANLVRDWIADGLDVRRLTEAEQRGLPKEHAEGCPFRPSARGKRFL